MRGLRAASIVPYAVLLVFLSACTGSDVPHDERPTQTDVASESDLPSVVPLSRPIDAQDVPPALPDEPTVQSIEDAAANTRPGRTAAEEFALKFSQALADVRRPLDMEGLLDDVSCSELPAAQRQALIDEVRMQRSAKTMRRWNTSRSMWIRAQHLRSGYGVEVAGILGEASAPVWSLLRIDVLERDGSWCLANVGADNLFPDDLSIPMEKADIRDSLGGAGWREIRP